MKRPFLPRQPKAIKVEWGARCATPTCGCQTIITTVTKDEARKSLTTGRELVKITTFDNGYVKITPQD